MNRSSMTVPQLREIAAELDIAGRSRMKKAELIAAIEYAEAPRADSTPGGVEDHAAAVAQMYANIAAEDEERAAARRARNRTNYAPAPVASDHNPHTDGRPAAWDVVGDSVSAMIEQDAPNRIRFDAPPMQQRPPVAVNEVAILRDAPGRAIVTAAFDGQSVGGSIVRKGKRLVLRAGDITVTGTTFEKVAKLFAHKLGFRVEIIDVVRAF